MTRANTTIESISSKPHELRAPLHGVLAPGKCVHTVRSIASVAEIYECSLAAIQGIPMQGAARVRLPFVARNAAAGVEATPGVDNPAPVELPPETPTRAVGAPTPDAVPATAAAPEPRPERVTSTILPPPPPLPAPAAPTTAPTPKPAATPPLRSFCAHCVDRRPREIRREGERELHLCVRCAFAFDSGGLAFVPDALWVAARNRSIA